MNQVDPMADRYSSHTPYNYSFNSPVVMNDPNGADPNPGEPDHVTRRGMELDRWFNGNTGMFQNMQTNTDYGLFDMNFNGGYGNLGGIANGNQQLSDYYSMSNGNYSDKYSTMLSSSQSSAFLASLIPTSAFNVTVTDPNSCGTMGYSGLLNKNGDILSTIRYNSLEGSDAEGWTSVGSVSYSSLLLSYGVPIETQESDRSPSADQMLLAAGSILNIFGIGTTLAIEGPKPTYVGPKEWASRVTTGAKFGNRLGAAGLVLTGADMMVNGVNTSNSMDAYFGTVSFGGPIGAAIGGTYFVGNLLTLGVTGQTIGQHVDNNFYTIPTGLPGVPIMFIPKPDPK
jgi:hypothetical protein